MRPVGGDLHKDSTGRLGHFTSHFDQHRAPGGDVTFTQRVLAASAGVVPAALFRAQGFDGQRGISYWYAITRTRIIFACASLGETEASSAGEQLAEGYPSRAVTDHTPGEVFGPPQPPSIRRYCPLMPQKTPARRAERIARWLSPANVVRVSGKVWSYYPERASSAVLHTCQQHGTPGQRLTATDLIVSNE